MLKRIILKTLKYSTALGLLLIAAASAYVYTAVIPKLPSIDSVRDVRLQVPMRIFSNDGLLIAEYGEKKRTPLSFEQTPEQMIQAILAAEDDRFFEHPGVDYQGILRAVGTLLLTGEKSQGGSTITMQVIRNYFLTREKTYLRKLNEILLSLKIEKALSKEEILELYLNKIFLGNRAYGFGAAAQVYYGKPIHQLTLPQMAMLAGLPKAPSRYNPIANLDRATLRRDYVLRRMLELGYIDQASFQNAINTPDDSQLYTQPIQVDAPYVAEMVRAELYNQYGNRAYTDGIQVYTTLKSDRQLAANAALQNALLNYERRHGYRGPLGHIELNMKDSNEQELLQKIAELNSTKPLDIAVVTEVADQYVTALTKTNGAIQINWEELKWARQAATETRGLGPAPKKPQEVLSIGDIIEVQQLTNEKWGLAQTPQIEGTFVALSPVTGAIQALVGGYDFYRSKFNRAVQGTRQPGSNFKPFIYTAALDKGYTPATLINDAPVVFEDDALETMWRPENYSGKFFGPTRMREALIHSRNLVSIRILQDIGIQYAINYAERFGLDRGQLPKDLSLALGSASLSPLQIATGYATLANGGFKIEPYYIDRIIGGDGNILQQATPRFACTDCLPEESEHLSNENSHFAPRVISSQTIYQINSILKDVVKRGTGRRALRLGRDDLHGKTGTTNDQFDAWFSGFSPAQIATAWVGFDQPQALGSRETGGRAALPMWIDYMEQALKGIPDFDLPQPPGMITVRIDPVTGKLAHSNDSDAIFETFRAEHVPHEMAPKPQLEQVEHHPENSSAAPGEATPPPPADEELF